MTYPRIRKQESNKDFWFYLIFYCVVGLMVILFVGGLVLLGISTITNYNKALNDCLDKGYSKEYCEYMMN